MSLRALVLICGLLLAAPALGMSLETMRGSVFKIEVVSQTARFSRPWLQNSSRSSTGTGFYIGDGRILTNAHVVANGKFITVQRDGDDQPQEVRVRYIAHDCDLAILEPKNPRYLEKTKALSFGGLPRLLRTVSTVGYPRGGDQLSITEGVVSRISYRRYAHTAYHEHLLVQVDSAINPGNSGGPVLQGSRVVGVAFQSFTAAENTGYIIPTPVIRRFLVDVEDGRYDGHPEDGISIVAQALENPASRRYYGLRRGDGGVVVAAVDSFAPTAGLIKPDDVLLAIGGQAIGVDGKVRFQEERVEFKVIFDLQQIGNVIDFKILRNGRERTVPVRIKPSKLHPHVSKTFPAYPRYFIYAGLVFTPATRNYLEVWGKRWFRDSPLLPRYALWNWQWEETFKNQKDLVMLTARLPHPVNAYAATYDEKLVTAINGQNIESLEDVESALQKGTTPFHVIEFFGFETPLVLEREKAQAVHDDILKNYGIAQSKWFSSEDGAQGGEP